jgi:phage antirepressor YoqD-like protein
MANKGIKIKELAKELGVTSRDLINRCREEGLPIQNSVTRVPPEAEHTIRGWFTDSRMPQVSPDRFIPR